MREKSDEIRETLGERMTDVGIELQRLVRSAAGEVHAGETVKAQMMRAHEALKRPDWWRFKAAWYGEAHGGWPVSVVDDFRARAAARKRDKEEATAREQTSAAATLAALRRRYAATDPEFFGEQIGAIERALGIESDPSPDPVEMAGKE